MAGLEHVLHTHPEPDVASISQPPASYTYYHAGPLFNLGDLTNNVRLSKAIHQLSNGKYVPILPQDLEQRDTSPHSIRDYDIKALLSCDLALFTYDGCELDSGTVVEYMVAKFADIPSVILRSDFRGGGDQASHQGDPWNLMSSFWPRTVGVVVNAMMEYKVGLAQAMSDNQKQSLTEGEDLSTKAGDLLLQTTAERVVAAFDDVSQKPSRMPRGLRSSVYQWLSLMPAFRAGTDSENAKELSELLHQKQQRGLFDS